MAYSRDELLAQIAEQLDAVGDPRYASESNLILPVLDAVYHRGWSKILAANSTYRWNMRTATTNPDGSIALSVLNGGSGDTLERLHKVLAVAQGQIRFLPSHFMDNPLAFTTDPIGSPAVAGPVQYTFQRNWQAMHLYPLRGGVETRVWVNHIPQRPSQLSAGGVDVQWPEDYELILVYETTARMAGKGAAETSQTDWHQQFADDLWKDLLSDVARFTTEPIVMGASDLASDWGG